MNTPARTALSPDLLAMMARGVSVIVSSAATSAPTAHASPCTWRAASRRNCSRTLPAPRLQGGELLEFLEVEVHGGRVC